MNILILLRENTTNQTEYHSNLLKNTTINLNNNLIEIWTRFLDERKRLQGSLCKEENTLKKRSRVPGL